MFVFAASSVCLCVRVRERATDHIVYKGSSLSRHGASCVTEMGREYYPAKVEQVPWGSAISGPVSADTSWYSELRV